MRNTMFDMLDYHTPKLHCHQAQNRRDWTTAIYSIVVVQELFSGERGSALTWAVMLLLLDTVARKIQVKIASSY